MSASFCITNFAMGSSMRPPMTGELIHNLFRNALASVASGNNFSSA
jgi:hypothetical protein